MLPLASPSDQGKIATPNQIPHTLIIAPWLSLVSRGVSESVKTKVPVPNIWLLPLSINDGPEIARCSLLTSLHTLSFQEEENQIL